MNTEYGAALSFERSIPFKGAPVEAHTLKSSVKVFDLESEEIKADFHESCEATVVKWLPKTSQPTLAYCTFGSGTGSIKICNAGKKKLIKVLKGHSAKISDLVITDDGKNLFSSGFDGKIIFWDQDRSDPIDTIAAHPGMIVSSMSTQPKDPFISGTTESDLGDARNGKVLLYARQEWGLSGTSSLRIISLHNYKETLFEQSTRDFIQCCTFLDFPYFACGGDSGKVYYFDWRKSSKPVYWMELRGAINSMAAYGKSVICGAADGSCFMRSPISNRNNDAAVEFVGGESEPIVKCSLNGRNLLTCSPDGKIRRYELNF